MRHVNLLILIALTHGILVLNAGAQDDKSPSLEQDLQRLQGEWTTRDFRKPSAKGVQCLLSFGPRNEKKKPGVHFSSIVRIERGRGTSSGAGFGGEAVLKESKGKRWIEQRGEKKLPSALYYRLDGETLILQLQTGEFKGEYKLSRVKKKE